MQISRVRRRRNQDNKEEGRQRSSISSRKLWCGVLKCTSDRLPDGVCDRGGPLHRSFRLCVGSQPLNNLRLSKY
jgi:hypothetical protein